MECCQSDGALLYHNASCVKPVIIAKRLDSVVSDNVKLHQGGPAEVVHQQRHL